MALTLLEASKINSGDVKRSAVIEMFAEANDIMRVMPFINIQGGSYSYNQEGTLPGVAFRGYNQAYTESVGVLNPQVEVLRIAGGDLDVDKALIKTRGADVRASQEAMKVKALSLHLMGKVINGDSVATPEEFDGLKNRLTGSQLIPADLSSTDGGDPLSLLQLDKAVDAVDAPTHVIMSKAMRRRLTVSTRSATIGGNGINWRMDEFGQQSMFYQDLPIIIADYDDTGARVIDFDEVGPTGATATASSIYVVSFGEDMLTGLQNGTMEVTDLGEIDSKPVLRTRVEWLVGVALLHGRCAARVYGISDAAVVA